MKRNKMRVMEIEKIDDIMIGRVINTALSYVFGYDENGVQEYYPYFKMRGIKNGIVRNLFLGLTFEDGDDVDKLIYEDKNINKTYDEFWEANKKYVLGLMDTYEECIEYEKSKANSNNKLSEKLLEILETQKQLEDLKLEIAIAENRALNQQIKANEYNERIMEFMLPEDAAKLNKMILDGGFDMEKMSDMVVQKYLGSGIMESHKDEIIEAKNEKIRSLEEYKKLSEARNVLSDK